MSSAAAAREPLPPRPYLPPSMAGALAACTGSAAFMRAGWRAFVSADAATLGGLWAAACGASILAVLVAALVRALLARRTSRASRWISAAAVWAAGAFAVCALSSACVVGERFGELDALVAHPMSSYVFAPAADGRFGAYGFQVAADVLLPDGTRVGGVLLSLDEEPRAARLRLVGRCVRFEDEPWDRSRFMAGAVAEVEAVRVQDEAGASEAGIGAVRAQALSVIDPASSPARALVAGIVCGRTTELAQTEGQEWFSATGTSHLVAVSGSHLAFVSSLAGVVLERTRTPLAARSCLLFALAAAYVVFTGGAASAVRSLIMVASASAPRALGRRAHGPSGLSLAVMLMLAVDPGTVFDLGFQLSVASVLFIGLFFRYLAWHVEAWGAPALLAEPLALTLSAQWATLPVTVPVFGEVSLIAPVANLVLGPVMSALLVAGLVLAPVAMAVPALTAAALAPLDLIASIALFTAELMADAPGALLVVDSESATLPVAAVLLALAAGAYALWRRIPRAFAVGALAALLVIAGAHAARWRFFAPAAVTVLDVGQGDAILVRDGTDAVLVDCGVDDAVASALARASVMHLDAVVITHWTATTGEGSGPFWTRWRWMPSSLRRVLNAPCPPRPRTSIFPRCRRWGRVTPSRWVAFAAGTYGRQGRSRARRTGTRSCSTCATRGTAGASQCSSRAIPRRMRRRATPSPWAISMCSRWATMAPPFRSTPRCSKRSIRSSPWRARRGRATPTDIPTRRRWRSSGS